MKLAKFLCLEPFALYLEQRCSSKCFKPPKMNQLDSTCAWAEVRKWFIFFTTLLLLFSAVNYTALLGDSVYAGNNGPTYLADRVYPFVILPVYLEAPVFPILSRLGPLLHLPPFVDFTDPRGDIILIVFMSSFPAVVYSLIGLWLRKIRWLKRAQERVPQWLPRALFTIIALFFIGLAVYLTVSINNYVPPPIPD